MFFPSKYRNRCSRKFEFENVEFAQETSTELFDALFLFQVKFLILQKTDLL